MGLTIKLQIIAHSSKGEPDVFNVKWGKVERYLLNLLIDRQIKQAVL